MKSMVTNKARHALFVAGTVFSASLLFGATSSSAVASDGEADLNTVVYFMETNDGDPGGMVTFFTDWDKVQLDDQQADGKSVQLTVWNETKDPDQYEYTIKASGDGERVEVHDGMGQPWNLAEGDCFKFRIQLVDGPNETVVAGSTDYAQWENTNGISGLVEDCDGVE
ncbi:hypothetical protein ACFZAV_21965 [Streptomyces sp. NPDC008343]|uniref:hypothetical protein n=1 Tax=Streptomyces sp. NPDC008343 TaxID=3364828 RepID=UPI0036EDB88B